MIQTRLIQLSMAALRQTNLRGDQVRVEPRGIGRLDQLCQITPPCGLAARQVQFQNTRLGRLIKDIRPDLGLKFCFLFGHLYRIRTIGA